MNETQAAVVLEHASSRTQTIWENAALSQTETQFSRERPNDWQQLCRCSDQLEMRPDYCQDRTDASATDTPPDYRIYVHLEERATEQERAELDSDVAREFADQWAVDIQDVIEDAQMATTLSATEFAALITMETEVYTRPKYSNSEGSPAHEHMGLTEQEAATSLDMSVETYKETKARVRSKLDACSHTSVLPRLIKLPISEQYEYSHGIDEARIEATAPSDVYQEQIRASTDSSLRLPREHPSLRDSETYDKRHWRTAHVVGVDNVSVTELPNSDEHAFRINIDGVGGIGGDMNEIGENLQVTTWLSETQATELLKQLRSEFDS